MQIVNAFMVIIFLAVMIIKRFYLQIILSPFLPSLQKPPAPPNNAPECIVPASDYHKTFDKIHRLLKKKIQSFFLLYFAC